MNLFDRMMKNPFLGSVYDKCEECWYNGKVVEMVRGHDCYKCPECGAEIIKACGERWVCVSAEAVKRREVFWKMR